MRVVWTALVGIAALAAAAAGCRHAEDGDPVGRLGVEPRRVRLDFPGVATLRLDWTPSKPIDSSRHPRPTVFVHLLDRPHHVLRTFDHELPRAWRPGERISYDIELYQSALGLPLAPGTYMLSAGLYDTASGFRWPLAADGPDVGRREYRVASVEAGGAIPNQPRFLFAGGWRPVLEGESLQAVGRRCLDGNGEVAVRGPHGAGTMRMLLRGTLAEGSLASDCAAVELRPDATGARWADVGIGSEPCHIRFAGSATSPPAPGPGLCLDVLSWNPEGGAAERVSEPRTKP